MSPRNSRSILPASLSTQVTETPNSEKQAPDTNPTYPVPIIAMRIDPGSSGLGKCSGKRPIRGLIPEFRGRGELTLRPVEGRQPAAAALSVRLAGLPASHCGLITVECPKR